jgi:hypothetical protein
MRATPRPVTSPVYSGISNDTLTWLWAARLYTSSGWMSRIRHISEDESDRSA